MFSEQLNIIVLDVVVTRGSAQICNGEVAGSHVEPDHVGLVQYLGCVLNESRPVLNKVWICGYLKYLIHVKVCIVASLVSLGGSTSA